MPVAAIIDKANHLSASKLSERLPVPLANDEIRQLSLTLNRLLERLQRAFESQERFLADASHQLRTPLAIIRGELDVFKTRPRTQAEISEFLASGSQELEHLSKMVDDLLLLARVDSGAGTLVIEKIRVDEVLLEVSSRLEPIAKQKDIRIRFDLRPWISDKNPNPFEITGDRDLVRSLFQSILENAIQHSPK